MDPASGFDMETASETYPGPDRFAPDGAVVREVVRTGDFEAVLSWVAGFDEARPFTVHTETGPARLVVVVSG
jgi:hypothetical protein